MFIDKIIQGIKRRRNYIQWLRERGMHIGENCDIHKTAYIGSESYLISIGNHVRINMGVQFVTHDGGTWVLREYLKSDNKSDIDLFGKISVGNNVHIGSHAIIMPGVVIGSNCIIGCGAIVTKDIPDNSIVVGVPARIIETIDEYYEKHWLDFDHTKNMTNCKKKEYLVNKYHLS